jgi:hypothetical protein
LNHHIRNAVFPLSLAIHKSGDANGITTAQDAVERINIALKDATVDALSGRTQYRSDGAFTGTAVTCPRFLYQRELEFTARS